MRRRSRQRGLLPPRFGGVTVHDLLGGRFPFALYEVPEGWELAPTPRAERSRIPRGWRPEGDPMSNMSDMSNATTSRAEVWPADRRITVHDLQAATHRGERWSMLTS